MAESTSVASYATFLANCIRDQLGLPLPAQFEAMFINHVRRLGSVDYEDFGSMVLLECEEQRQAGTVVDEIELQRMLDRIRHRLVRRAQREVPFDVNQQPAAKATLSSANIRSAIQDFMAQLSPTDAVIFELRCLSNQPPKQIASQTGLSVATIYRTLAELRNKFAQFVSER